MHNFTIKAFGQHDDLRKAIRLRRCGNYVEVGRNQTGGKRRAKGGQKIHPNLLFRKVMNPIRKDFCNSIHFQIHSIIVG